MQPTESFSVPRRALDVEDYIDIVRRHKGWIFGPFLLCLVASVVGVYLWPDTYVSTAVVKVTPQQVPEAMVQSTHTQQMFDQINSMEQVILSRSTLTTIINNYGLYQRERARMPIEDVIDMMKKAIIVAPVATAANSNSRTIPAFAVQYSYEDRYKAQRVVSDLTSRFIDESTRNRSSQSYITTQFMKDEVDQAKKDLDTVENKLTEFRMQNNGRLPDQVQSNTSALQALNIQVNTVDAAISRATQDKLQIETRRQILKDNLAELNKQPPPETAGLAVQKSEKLIEAERDVTVIEDRLRALKQKYADNYPDVQTAQGLLAAAKQKRDEIVKDEAAAKPADKTPAARPENPQLIRDKRELENNIRQLDSAIEAKDLEIQNYNKDLKRTSEAIKMYQSRIETLPLGEKQYSELMRDREISRDHYNELEQKYQKALVAQEMENRKEGELLELLDPASLPQSPTEPKRPLIISIGAVLGLLLGVVIAGAREMKDTALKNLKDVRAYTQMAILGSVPLLENDFVVRRRKRLAWLGWTTAGLAAAVIMAGSVVYYYTTKV
jgi:polysaccharide chain length determinant protein (PEP-CTERM system associated)